MTPPYPPQQPGWQPPPGQQGQPPPGWQQPYPQQYPQQQPLQRQQQPRAATVMIAGILALLGGLVYAGYWVVVTEPNLGWINAALFVALYFGAGILLLLGKRTGSNLANGAGALATIFGINTLVTLITQSLPGSTIYFSVTLLLLGIALLVVNNLTSTRKSCLSWETRRYNAPPQPPKPAAIIAIVVGAIYFVVSVYFVISDSIFSAESLISLVISIAPIVGGVLLLRSHWMGQRLVTIGIIPGTPSFVSVPLANELHLTVTVIYSIIIVITLISFAVLITAATATVDRALAYGPVRRGPLPGQFPPVQQGPPQQPVQFQQQSPPPGWQQPPPGPPQQPHW